jgi:EAL domain-containing protein (putative c-di-GMP-specific phosphodiesterase class I)
VFETNEIDKIKDYCFTIQNQLETLDLEIIDGLMINLDSIVTIAKGEKEKLLQHLRISQLEARDKKLNFYLFEQEAMETIKQQEKNIYWSDFLKKSFKNDSIVPFFQPIVASQTGEIIKYECLARIKDGEKVISPVFFINAAKNLGLITQITRIMIEKSFKIFANSSMELSINITKEDLMEGYLLEFLDSAVEKYKLKKKQIILEILEEISVCGEKQVLKELLALKQGGYKIALDDFGSENSSFSRMLDLKVDILKIDGSFIKNIHTHHKSRLIVEGILHIAKLLNYEVVAEFVHDKEVLRVINELGIDYSQGYYFSEPLDEQCLCLPFS